jgi:ATP-dependent DNA ligase
MAELDALVKKFIAEGYEGAIARKDAAGYRYGYSNYHSANLLKIKPKYDAEFPVVGYTQGTRGKDVGAVIWVCEVPDPKDPHDKTFNVVPKNMNYKTRKAIYECLGQKVQAPDGQMTTRFERDVKGLPLTVEFAESSAETGKPLQAKALTFRTYESGPDNDPIRKLMAECAIEQ